MSTRLPAATLTYAQRNTSDWQRHSAYQCSSAVICRLSLGSCPLSQLWAARRQYLNNLPADDGRIARGLWGANYDRLVTIKRRYDPENRFRLNHNINPA